MSALWNTMEMVEVMGARPFGPLPESVSGVAIDTRTLKPGEAFFAIKGDQFDGHNFMTQAMKAGASVAIVAEEKLVALGSQPIPLLVVPDVLEALGRLGVAARKRSQAKVIAVTGSAGKTTTKELLRAVLGASGKVHASPASFNNHWGVPLTLARLPTDCRFAVFEIGMNHAGEITPLVAMVRPHVAIVTTVAAAHLGSFSSIDDIARAKAEIFTGVTPGGVALINCDIPHYEMLRELAGEAGVEHIAAFGAGKNADFRLIEAETGPEGSKVLASLGDDDVEFFLPMPGKHMVANALAVLGAAMLVGADLEAGMAALGAAQAQDGRGLSHRIVIGGGFATIIDETYNANPASVAAALQVLGSHKPAAGGRRIAVLGDMLELGSHSVRLHRELKEPIERNGIDLVYLAGPEMAALAEELAPPLLGGYFADPGELGPHLAKAIVAGDVVMLKASNGLKFLKIVETILGAYPDQEAGAR